MQPFSNLPESDVDVMMRDMKRANRKPLLIGLGVIAGLGVSFGLYVLSGRSAVASELAQLGYSATKITMNGPFSWGFAGKKGTAACGGTFERLPFSSSTSESCFDTAPAKSTEPARPVNEVLEDGLRKKFSSLSVSAIRCAAVDPAATKTTCMVEADDTPIEVLLAKSAGEWKMEKPERVAKRSTLADALSKEVREQANANHGRLRRRARRLRRGRHTDVHRLTQRRKEAGERDSHLRRRRLLRVEGKGHLVS